MAALTAPGKTETGRRETFLDLLRIIACFMVIVNHTSSEIFLARSPQERIWFLTVAWFFASKPAVPIFYMISGYLLLGRQDSWKRAWGRIHRILVVLLGSAAVYAVFHAACDYPDSSLGQIVKEFFRVWREPPSNALWYLYAYLGLLILLPFFQKMAQAMEKKDYYILFALYGVFEGLLPIAIHYNPAMHTAWPFDLPMISNAVVMAFAGNYFARFGVKKTRRGFFLGAALLAAMVVLSTGLTWLEYQRIDGNYLFFDYRELMPNTLATVSLFYLATFAGFSPGMGRLVSWIGSCTFGMYLIGDILFRLMVPVRDLLAQKMHIFAALVLFELILFCTALAVTALVRKIPWARKWI